MKAHMVTGAIPVEVVHILEGKVVFETTCHDFDHYKALPNVVAFKGVECVLTGWSSDTNRACYKQTDMIARVMR